MKINQNFFKIESSYLFSTVARKQREYQEAHPEADIIRLSIGDVTRPLAPSVIDAMHKAVDEMANEATFRGYPPEHGYEFILDAIQQHDYAARGVNIEKDEIFLSDGAKSDCGNIGDLFSVDNKIAVCDPVYPVYVDANTMDGRSGDKNADGFYSNFIYMPCTEENGFMPDLPKETPDVIYLCFPNNPTGMCATKAQLKKWVDYALANDALIIFDSAYEAFIVEDDVPHSIYEIEGAEKCAIELRSFSKTAGFTGVRCGYTVVPKACVFEGKSLNPMWARRQATKFNGVSYITQRAAEAVYTEQGQKEIKETLAYYQKNAQVIFEGMQAAGFTCYGAVNSPYVWLKVPEGMTSWEFFDLLLDKTHVVGTPGSGFGPSGEGFFRLTAFGNADKTVEAVERIKATLPKTNKNTHPLIYQSFCRGECVMNKTEQLYEGKAKKVWATEDPTIVIVDYKDDATAFNGLKKGTIVGKGVVNNKMSNYLMQLLEKHGVPTHFVEELSDRETAVKKVTIVPLEVIIRNRAAGSICKRLGLEEGMDFTQPSIEFSYKDDDLGDPLINGYHAVSCGFATQEEIDTIKAMAFKVNDVLKEYFASIGVELIDFKLEFGKTADGQIVLADEISPDTCRFWDIKTHEKLDKDRFRRDLGGVEDAYKEMMKRVGLD